MPARLGVVLSESNCHSEWEIELDHLNDSDPDWGARICNGADQQMQLPGEKQIGYASVRQGIAGGAEPYGLVRKNLIKRNRGLTKLQLNLKGFQVLNISI